MAVTLAEGAGGHLDAERAGMTAARPWSSLRAVLAVAASPARPGALDVAHELGGATSTPIAAAALAALTRPGARGARVLDRAG